MSQPKLNLLVAYPYLSKKTIDHLAQFEKENAGVLRFFLDSGAFTAFSSGKPIELDDYCRFLDSLPFKPWRYFALDVIGDEDGTVRNYDKMLERGFKPVPIFTRGSDYEVIDYYYSKTDFIAYGGLVNQPKNKLLAYIDRFQKKIDGRKAHLLGYTSMSAIKHFKPYSCDSSSWEGGARFGVADIYAGSGNMIKAKKADFLNRPSEKVITACRELGVDINQTKGSSGFSGGHSFLRLVGGASWVKMSLDCEKQIGTKLFLASATTQATKILTDAYSRVLVN